MKRSRFTEEQIIAILREQEAGMGTPLCDLAKFYLSKGREKDRSKGLALLRQVGVGASLRALDESVEEAARILKAEEKKDLSRRGAATGPRVQR